jgi:hypothetical protein
VTGVVAVTGGRSERAWTAVYTQSACGDCKSVPGLATDGLPLPAWAHLDPDELPGIDAATATLHYMHTFSRVLMVVVGEPRCARRGSYEASVADL